MSQRRGGWAPPYLVTLGALFHTREFVAVVSAMVKGTWEEGEGQGHGSTAERERTQADPAEAVAALLATHILAALVLPDEGTALGTVLGVLGEKGQVLACTATGQ